VEPLLLADVPDRPNVGKREIEAILVFIANRSERKPPILDADSATIPVVRGLYGRVLQKPDVDVIAHAGRSAEAALIGMAVAEQHAKLVELSRRARGAREVRGCANIGVPSAESEQAKPVIEQCSARIHSARLKIVVQIPLGIGIVRGLHAQSRNQ